jgi:hypothetical protein
MHNCLKTIPKISHHHGVNYSSLEDERSQPWVEVMKLNRQDARLNAPATKPKKLRPGDALSVLDRVVTVAY